MTDRAGGAAESAVRAAEGGRGRAVRAAIWLPGLAVALGAAVATAHGLFEVAVAARVPAGIAWLYPLITDGLALVAYAATARLTGRAARYAWSVVVAAAGLSGLAQAAYLAADAAVATPAALRFGVGAWPAVAAAVVAHLLYLLTTADPAGPAGGLAAGVVQSPPFDPRGVQPTRVYDPAVQPTALPGGVQPGLVEPDGEADPWRLPATRPAPSPARDRAEETAQRFAQRHGAWPTVSELEAAAEVSRGTAAAALKALRTATLPLHLIPTPGTGTTKAPEGATDDEKNTAMHDETSTQP